MYDDIYNGILSGLFGPVIARLMSRFKYRVIFAVVLAGTYLLPFITVVRANGWSIGCKLFVQRVLTPVGVLVPLGIGLLVVACVFISSIGSRNKRE